MRLGNFEGDGVRDEAFNRAIGSARNKLNRFCGGYDNGSVVQKDNGITNELVK